MTELTEHTIDNLLAIIEGHYKSNHTDYFKSENVKISSTESGIIIKCTFTNIEQDIITSDINNSDVQPILTKLETVISQSAIIPEDELNLEREEDSIFVQEI